MYNVSPSSGTKEITQKICNGKNHSRNESVTLENIHLMQKKAVREEWRNKKAKGNVLRWKSVSTHRNQGYQK